MIFSDYIEEFNRINGLIDVGSSTVKIAVLRSFVLEQLEKIIVVEAYKKGINARVKFGQYNQFHQEILNDNSILYEYRPDIIILAVRLEELQPKIYNDYTGYCKDNDLADILYDLENMIAKIKGNLNCDILINNFILPDNTYSSLFDFQSMDGRINYIRRMNLELVKLVKKYTGVYIVDVENLASMYGKMNITDKKMWYLAKMPYKIDFMKSLALEYIKYLTAIYGMKKKCIVLDLDNTLWGGIIGEDGITNIKLGNDYPGNCYKDFQKELLKYKGRGILLAINSKNNYEDAIEVIINHSDMILGMNDFASIRINWNDKVDNLRSISEELNISLDSMVFIDDSKAECENIRNRLPDVHTLNLSDDITKRVDQLRNLNLFETLNITDEDTCKTDMYIAEKNRNEIKKSLSLSEYLKSLNTVVKIFEANELMVSRLAQLTQKTNQFNLTTKRYTESDIYNFIMAKDKSIYAISVCDRFGDYGIVGLCIITPGECFEWVIDSFLLSCRILGRNIEDAFIFYIINKAKKEKINRITGLYYHTGKNKPSEFFYEKTGFEKINDNCFIYDINKAIMKCPEHITVL